VVGERYHAFLFQATQPTNRQLCAVIFAMELIILWQYSLFLHQYFQNINIVGAGQGIFDYGVRYGLVWAFVFGFTLNRIRDAGAAMRLRI
jgi:hypothetical protein